MKHLLSFLTLLLAALLPFDLSAAPVSAEKAQAKAIAFFVQSTPTRSAPSLRLVWDGESAATRANAEPALYVFNRTDAPGFVIMAGDDAVTPILGYSFGNPFGDVNRMPANLRWWLDGLRSMILDARASGAAADAAWSSVSRADEEGSKVLETALWDQEDPYNGECPEYNGKRLYTGCTQTAEAIVMKYNRWPETVGKSVLGYRSESTDKDDKPLAINVKGRTLGTYDWDLMPDKYDKSATPEQRAEVARLMADLGVLNQAKYGEEGTGAYSNDQHKGLVSVLKYSKQARLVNRDGYTDEEWLALMRAEIDANRPVLYSGVSKKEDGHAFVLAGYKPNSPECYFNWGWSGDGNGWFTVAKFGTPPANPFLLMQDAIVGLVKDPDESSQYSDNLMLGAQQANDGTYYVGLKSAADVIGAVVCLYLLRRSEIRGRPIPERRALHDGAVRGHLEHGRHGLQRQGGAGPLCGGRHEESVPGDLFRQGDDNRIAVRWHAGHGGQSLPEYFLLHSVRYPAGRLHRRRLLQQRHTAMGADARL